MRFRLLVAVMVAGLLSVTGIASAQTTTTDPTSSYTTTTPTATQPATSQGTTEVKPSTDGSEQSNAAPAVAAQPAGSAPSNLAFTGGEPLVFILFGFVLAGAAATLLVRDRRRAPRDR